MEFLVLGPVGARHDERELKLGGPKQRLVLAILLAARGASVSAGALMDGLWGEDPPPTARKALQGYVHHLRTEVGDVLLTDAAGYSLRVADSEVDERQFGEIVTEARGSLTSAPLQASERLAEALGLWRGTAYSDLDGEPVLRPEITRLEELRVVALADRIEADLAIGRHDTLIGELESLTAEYPLRERFRSQHMLALYRAGRQGEALRAFSKAREHFIEEMGIDPSEELADLEERILARDDSLDVENAPPSGQPVQAVRGYELRDVLSTTPHETVYRGYQRSVGREVTMRVVGPELANDPEFITRYEADTVRVAALDHPSIAAVYDSWREPGRVYVVGEWIDGEQLDRYLETARPEPTAALRVMEQVGAALDVAHRSGVVHGNVGGHSVTLASTGDAFLSGFSIGSIDGSAADDRMALARLGERLFTTLPADATTTGSNSSERIT